MTKSIWFGLFSMLVLALASGQVHADSKADAEAELKRARDLDSRGDHKKACKAFQHAGELAQGQSAPIWIGLSDCYLQDKNVDKAVAAARQAVAVAATPEERTEATSKLADNLLRQHGEPAWTEALALFKEQVAGSGGTQGQRGVINALLMLHRDQEAAEILAALRKQGKNEGDIQQQVLFGLSYPSPGDDKKQLDDFNERLYRLDPETPLRVGSKVTRPEILHQVKPETTEEALRHRGFSGTVILETVIDKDGKVTNVRVLKGQPMGLSESAMDAVKQWTFKPAILDGKPVRVFYILTVNYQIG
ncbi:MAG TPA: energy transducer TonB [Thermoanaerobaculia bacterium]|jgi:TonB family protein